MNRLSDVELQIIKLAKQEQTLVKSSTKINWDNVSKTLNLSRELCSKRFRAIRMRHLRHRNVKGYWIKEHAELLEKYLSRNLPKPKPKGDNKGKESIVIDDPDITSILDVNYKETDTRIFLEEISNYVFNRYSLEKIKEIRAEICSIVTNSELDQFEDDVDE